MENDARCACFNLATGWIDAGCIWHGIKSSLGRWEGEQYFAAFRDALFPDLNARRQFNVRGD